MLVIVMTIVLSLLLAGAALLAYLWAVKNGQYDDTYTPAERILQDDVPVSKEKSSDQNPKTEKK